MAESDFSWLKIASFIGALVLIVLTFITVANGISLITNGSVFEGIVNILGGAVCLVGFILVYKNYQKKSLENRSK